MKTIVYKNKKVKISPLLMKPDLVAQTLRGIKTQTRRLNGLDEINEAPNRCLLVRNILPNFNQKQLPVFRFKYTITQSIIDVQCPYGQKGDIIWVRETFFKGIELDENDSYKEDAKEQFWYLADDLGSRRPSDVSDSWCMHMFGPDKSSWPKWKPNLHMPKEACRLFLEITDVRIERLQDITNEDAIAEGIHVLNQSTTQEIENGTIYKKYDNNGRPFQTGTKDPKISYLTLWKSINGVGSWDRNPWVWVVNYKVIPKPENF